MLLTKAGLEAWPRMTCAAAMAEAGVGGEGEGRLVEELVAVNSVSSRLWL